MHSCLIFLEVRELSACAVHDPFALAAPSQWGLVFFLPSVVVLSISLERAPRQQNATLVHAVHCTQPDLRAKSVTHRSVDGERQAAGPGSVLHETCGGISTAFTPRTICTKMPAKKRLLRLFKRSVKASSREGVKKRRRYPSAPSGRERPLEYPPLGSGGR